MMADPPAYAAEGLHTLPQLQVRCKLAVTSCWQFGICCFVCCLLRSSAIWLLLTGATCCQSCRARAARAVGALRASCCFMLSFFLCSLVGAKPSACAAGDVHTPDDHARLRVFGLCEPMMQHKLRRTVFLLAESVCVTLQNKLERFSAATARRSGPHRDDPLQVLTPIATSGCSFLACANKSTPHKLTD